MNKETYISLLLSFLFLSSCSTQAWYSGSKASHDISCLKESESDYEACIKENPHSYNEYKQARDELKTTNE